MKYRILCVGRIKEGFYRKRMEELCKQIQNNHSIQIMEVEDERTPDPLSHADRMRILKTEGERLLRLLPYNSKELIIALCIDGKQFSTEDWKKRLHQWMEQGGYEQVTYIIGGSLGLDADVIRRAHIRLSFSYLTFPHQLMRVMLAEQIAYTECACGRRDCKK